MLQPKLQVIICCNVGVIYYPGTPILNPLHTPKKIIVKGITDYYTCIPL